MAAQNLKNPLSSSPHRLDFLVSSELNNVDSIEIDVINYLKSELSKLINKSVSLLDISKVEYTKGVKYQKSLFDEIINIKSENRKTKLLCLQKIILFL